MPLNTDYIAPFAFPGAIALLYAGRRLRSEIEQRNNSMAIELADAANEDAKEARALLAQERAERADEHERDRLLLDRAREETDDARKHILRLQEQLRAEGQEPTP